MQTQNTSVVSSNNTNTTPSTTGNILNELKPGMVVRTPNMKPFASALTMHPSFDNVVVAYIRKSNNGLYLDPKAQTREKFQGVTCFLENFGKISSEAFKNIPEGQEKPEICLTTVMITKVNQRSVSAMIKDFTLSFKSQVQNEQKPEDRKITFEFEFDEKNQTVDLKKGTKIYMPVSKINMPGVGSMPVKKSIRFEPSPKNTSEKQTWMFKAGLYSNKSEMTHDPRTFVAVDMEQNGVVCFCSSGIPEHVSCFVVVGISKNSKCAFVEPVEVSDDELFSKFAVPHTQKNSMKHAA